MTLHDRLLTDLKEAMRSGNVIRRSILRLVQAGVHNLEIEKGRPADDSDVLAVIAKEERRHRESIAEFTRGKRPDLREREEAELEVLMEYLPQPVSQEELLALIKQAIQEVGAQGPKDKNKVMSRLMPQLRGKADGQEVSALVTQLLTAAGG